MYTCNPFNFEISTLWFPLWYLQGIWCTGILWGFPALNVGKPCNKLIFGDILQGFPVNFKLIACKVYIFFPLQFLHAYLKWEIMGITGIPAIPMMITCMLQGTLCDTGIPCTFYGGNVCSAASRHSVVDASSNSKFLSLVSSGYNTSKIPCLIHRVKIFFFRFQKNAISSLSGYK